MMHSYYEASARERVLRRLPRPARGPTPERGRGLHAGGARPFEFDRPEAVGAIRTPERGGFFRLRRADHRRTLPLEADFGCVGGDGTRFAAQQHHGQRFARLPVRIGSAQIAFQLPQGDFPRVQFPPFLCALRARVAAWTAIPEARFEHGLVTEYSPGTWPDWLTFWLPY